MKKVWFKTYGCTLNYSDTEVMKGLLQKAGFREAADQAGADLIIFNTCTVKDPAEKKFLYELSKTKKPVVIAGCVPQAGIERFNNYSVIGVRQLHKIVEVVEETLKGNVVHLIDLQRNKRLNLPKIRRNKLIEIIPTCNGCLGECAYCKTRLARGELCSYSPREIKKQFEDAVNEGIKEIWITSQDNGAYGKDIRTSLAELMKQLLETKGNYKIRIGMINPNFFMEDFDALIKNFKNDKVFKFVHLPAQAGNDRILSLMKRRYTRAEYIELIDRIMKEIPDITISTDIICGFPGETEKEFRESIELIKRTKPGVLNISKFYARPGTSAASMKQLDTKIIKRRSKELKMVYNQLALRQNQRWVGWTGEIYIDEKGKNNTFIGRNFAYKPVIVKNKKNCDLFGKTVKIKVENVTSYDLKAKII
jgi:MiaB-like tRNA modifying enzyme